MQKLSKNDLITLVELPPTEFGKLNGPKAADIFSGFGLPARALHILNAVLEADGWKNIRIINPLYHGDNGKLSKENWKLIKESKVLGLSTITRTAPQTYELSKAYHKLNPNGIVIMGGPHPTFEKEECLESGADIVVLYEGEAILVDLMRTLSENPDKIKRVKGIAFREKGKVITTPLRDLMTKDELGKLPHPNYDLDTVNKADVGVVMTSRGCVHCCDFCSGWKFYQRRFRGFPIEWVIEEMKWLNKKLKPRKSMMITDDNFYANPERSKEILRKMIAEGLNTRFWSVQVTVKCANDDEFLDLLEKANVKTLYIGIEALHDSELKAYKKPYEAKVNLDGLAKLGKRKFFWIHSMMMPGGIGSTPKTLIEDVETLKNLNVMSAQFFPCTDLPGTDFEATMKAKKKILPVSDSLRSGLYVTVIPENKNFTPYSLQMAVIDQYKRFYSIPAILKRSLRYSKRLFSLGVGMFARKNLRNYLNKNETKAHLKYLKSISYSERHKSFPI